MKKGGIVQLAEAPKRKQVPFPNGAVQERSSRGEGLTRKDPTGGLLIWRTVFTFSLGERKGGFRVLSKTLRKKSLAEML